MVFPKRTNTCGELRKEQENIEVVLNGWVAGVRDLGGLIFIDMRDRYGLTQIVIEPENRPDLAERAKELKSEFVIWVKGKVRLRSNQNPNIPTGLIEVLLDEYGILNKSVLPPFEIDDSIELQEETRLKYRYLDLRRPSLQKNLILRNELYQIMHKYYYENNFIEIETPFFMKSTPEGARDFLVPSRIHKGRFYALPQSPQLYKQILMISGFDRYVQIAKCFRDEDLRADRQPEFTQIDVEMSFIDEEDIIKMTEGFFKVLWKETLGIEIQTPFQRMSYKDAMEKYGSDKPDLRFGWELKDISDLVKDSEFQMFSSVVQGGGVVAVLNAKGCSKNYSRKKIDELIDFTKRYGGKLIAIKIDNILDLEGFTIVDKIGINIFKNIIKRLNVENGDILLFVADSWYTTYTSLGALRLEIAKQTGLLAKAKDKFAFLWVVDFPLFEYDEESKRHVAMHHPFTSPKPEDVEFIDDNPGKVRARAYDIVVNGAEVGGGSIRIHDTDVQQKMFQLLGLSQEEATAKFGFLLDALKYGAPPHGGIALGLDRLVMTLAGTENIRNVIAFPKTTSGLSLMDGSPSSVDEEQLKELGIKLVENG